MSKEDNKIENTQLGEGSHAYNNRNLQEVLNHTSIFYSHFISSFIFFIKQVGELIKTENRGNRQKLITIPSH